VLFDKKRKNLLCDNRLLGRWGQKQCENFLKRKGYKTLTKNFSCKSGEIDLIMATDDGTVVFVEVKTRKNEDFADAEAAVTSAKKQRMKKAANLFVKKYKLDDKPLRFDVVIVMADEKAKTQMRHYENAF
jgi:putative endonuclease